MLFRFWNKPLGWALVVIYSWLLCLLYPSSLTYLWSRWQGEDFSYCYAVPFIVAYLLWDKRERLQAVASRPSWVGLIPLLLGVGLYWLGELGGAFTALFLSLWLVAVGLLWLHLGWRKLKVIGFPVLFSLAMFTPPSVVYNTVLLKLKLISSQLGVKLMQLSGMSVYREGNIIDLGFTKLQVVDACSGLRYVIPLFIMGVLLAYFFRAPWWKRVVLVLSTLPLSIFTNSLRIAATGILYQWWGPAVAEGFFHDFSGWIIFMVCLAVLMGEMWLLKKIGSNGKQERAVFSHAAIPDTGHARTPSAASWRLPQFWGALLVLLATLGLAHGVDFRQKVPVAAPLEGFPLQVGPWRGEPDQLAQHYLDALHLSDYLLADYRNPQGREVNIYVAYNDSQSKGKASHSPASCLPGSGWVFEKAGLTEVPTPQGHITVSRALMQKNGSKRLVYYWFPQRGRVLHTMIELKLFAFWDALTRQRTDGALVRVITPVYENETVGEAEGRLQHFVGRVVPVLDSYIPK